ncbi:MAG: hypothetical protein VB067_03185 [Christensenellaceae bacterium]|nr:hypothetical protein [Christensenellaceae bacterium]MEA5067968.1 hypothetical protein [Christensenellaceae bacterium]
MNFEQLYAGRAAEAEAAFAACADVRAAAERAASLMDALADERALEEADAAARARAHAACRAAKAALMCLESATQADVRMVAERPERERSGVKDLLRYAPAGLTLLLAAWLYLSGQPWPASLALAAAALWALTAHRRPDAAPVRPEVTTKADARELSRRMAHLCREIDALCVRPEVSSAAPVGAPLLEAMQMLLEAEKTGDGAFALKSVPQLTDALQRTGVRFARYGDADPNDFDPLPARTGGTTVRPAVYQDGALVLRGQVTVKR